MERPRKPTDDREFDAAFCQYLEQVGEVCHDEDRSARPARRNSSAVRNNSMSSITR